MNFVYLTTNLVNGKRYVGSHNGDENDTYLGSGDIIESAQKKYGKKNFKREILETRKEAFLLEEKYIRLNETHVSQGGYNISWTGGMGSWGGKHSEETKKKLSEKRKGKAPWNKGKTGIYSKETLKRMRENSNNSGKNNPMFGKKGVNSPIFGIEKTLDHKKKLSVCKKEGKNPNANKYFIQAPDNKEFIVNSATEFVNKYPEYDINRHFIYYQEKKNTKRIPNKWYIIKMTD